MRGAGRVLLTTAMMGLLVMCFQPVSVAATADLLDALDEGTVWGEFYGTGELGVDATIGRNPGGPKFVSIAPGTQFWAQRGGRQGQSTLGWVPIDLSKNTVVHLRIPTACTNISRRAPTPEDEMFPEPCADDRMARLCTVVLPEHDEISVVQLAVWAIANNPSRRTLQRHERYMVDEQITQAAARTAAFEKLLSSAAKLLERADLKPAKFRMFR